MYKEEKLKTWSSNHISPKGNHSSTPVVLDHSASALYALWIEGIFILKHLSKMTWVKKISAVVSD